MKNTKIEKEKLATSKRITIGALAATAAALTVTAVFKKETRKAIVAGMVTGVAAPFIAKAIAKNIEGTAIAQAAQAVKEEFSEAYEAKKAELTAEILKEENSSEGNKEETTVVEQETVNASVSVNTDTVGSKEFEQYKDMIATVVNDLIDNMKILDERTRGQKDEVAEFSKLLNQTAKDISKTYIAVSKEVKAISEEVKALDKDNQAAKAIKEYLDENRKVIFEELGIKGSDLIANIDIEKFGEQAAQAAADEMATSVVAQMNGVMVKAIRQEIKDTGLAKELDEVKAFIEELKDGKELDEE